MLWRMLVLELWHRNFMEARSSWGVARLAPEIFASETVPLARPMDAVQVQS